MTAPICYFEIPAPDVERAGVFYADVFGWGVQASDLTDRPYAMLTTGDGSPAGGLSPDRAVADEGVILFLKVDDLAATIAAVDAAGGSLVDPPAPVGADYGISAVIRDPSGNRIGLWADA